ncbi:helix-turn-helix domain-containing protein [Agromyces sp. NPDC058104]|uniref:helix-turn-helix domain-containing protein n=1 Tax=Agromyces sp. NPDC058104 TaxID=3346342 RepID=UPI0036D8FE0F
MGRNRSFDERDVIARCAESFLCTGYEGTSIDDLVTASGLHRGSLYKAFGSKRGLFLEALRHADVKEVETLDLLLVALLELAPRDRDVRELCAERLAELPGGDPSAKLGARLLERADLSLPSITHSSERTS